MIAALQMVQEKFQMLSPQRQVEVVDFIDFLLSREAPKSRTKMELDWAGALEDMRDEYTSIELQRQANIWREEGGNGDANPD
jgi:hypothetical protein